MTVDPTVTDTGAVTDTEQRLGKLWARLLRQEDIPSDAGFFDIGGSSLLASRLLLRVKREFGVELTLENVYANSTLAEMAALVDGASTADATGAPLRA
ncbi:phosphopantetheine-binding protein [Streptomyces sp. NPDC057137]|uniref:phosphopantetheine-binding protein n=1 Tax=Streptomyces sp. NPDC057137 TaxID=3346030 RepID=UPI00363A4682